MKKVLILDDDKAFTLFISHVLSILNCEVFEMNHAFDALSFLKKKNKIDLILSDLIMPDLMGNNFIWTLRNNQCYSAHKDTPIIVITVLRGELVRAQLKEIGADTWVRKPITKNRLKKVLVDYL